MARRRGQRLVLSHPQSQYFVVGRLAQDQVADYAKRKGWTLAEAERWLAPTSATTRRTDQMHAVLFGTARSSSKVGCLGHGTLVALWVAPDRRVMDPEVPGLDSVGSPSSA